MTTPLDDTPERTSGTIPPKLGHDRLRLPEPFEKTVGSPLPSDLPVQILKASSRCPTLGLRELWRYRELIYFLTWRDVKIRYKQTVLGVTWAIIQPLATMVVFSLLFGRFAGLDQHTHGVPYPIYVYAALLPWTLFSNSVANCSQSLVNNASVITKVYFPRLVVPLAAVGTALVDFLVSLSVLFLLMPYYRVVPSLDLAWLPLFLLGAVVSAAGVGTLLSALTVAYRDFRYVVPFMLQFWMFLTPVIYPVAIVPERWRILLYLNPMTGVIEGFRAAFLPHHTHWPGIAVSAGMAVATLLLGVLYFRAVERRMADIV